MTQEQKENLIDNIRRQNDFIDWLRAKNDDSPTLDRACAQLGRYQEELTRA